MIDDLAFEDVPLGTSFQFKKTKIVATLGPATSSEEMIHSLIRHGMNVARLAFSHGTHENHKKHIAIIRKLQKEQHVPIALMQDLQGPKIRVGILDQEPIVLTKGQVITLFHGKEQTNSDIPIPVNIFTHVRPGNHVLINDGIIKLRVERIHEASAECTVLLGGEIRSHKGVNLPDTVIPNISLTEKDKHDLALGLAEKVDYILLSFVQDERDILHFRKFIAEHEHQPKIFVKIETAAAVRNLEKIVKEADGVMVARGDLAVEIGQEEVPIVQRKMVSLARTHNKPVIVATQMLESMIHNPVPTRAEVNDVATAVIEEADCVMLSAETAIGEYPVEAISIMNRIIERVGKYHQELRNDYHLESIEDFEDQTTAIAAAASVLAHQLKAKMLLSLTASGKTPLRLASYRPTVPVIAVTDNWTVYNQLALVWNMTPVFLPKIEDNAKAYEQVIDNLVKEQKIKEHDKIVLVTGTHPGKAGHTNIISVTRVGEEN